MNYLPTPVKRRCERCEELYDIPNVREGPIRERHLLCFPCPSCGYSQCDPKNTRTGRCKKCAIPFTVVDHHALGMCLRHYNQHMRTLRNEPDSVSFP